MKQNADITQDLQLLESRLQHVLQSPAYANLVRSGNYSPYLSLLDALHAVQECKRTNLALTKGKR
ncbi:hypothetical protein [Tolypothrix tenuis]|uniref:hypothetical protein n=1 Tax=Tolypothrix tenuis TaxID=457083 RepID=UPI0016884294